MKHWVFDLDGTLVDSFSFYFDILKTIFTETGIEFKDEHRRQSLLTPVPHFVAKFFEEIRVAEVISRINTQSNEDTKNIRPFDGVEKTLQHLASKNIPMAVWTSRDLNSASMILNHTGLKQYFEKVVSGTCVQKHKPNPEGLEQIIQVFGSKPSETVVVGDHEIDMLGTKSAGAVGVRASWHGYWDMEKCSHATHQFYTTDAFHKWVDESLL